MDELKVYVVGDVTCAPERLLWQKKEKQFSRHLKYIPSHIVCFALGDWKTLKNNSVEIHVGVGKENISLGTISMSQPCCMFEVNPGLFFLGQGVGAHIYGTSSFDKRITTETIQETLENTPQMNVMSPADVAKVPPKKERKRKTVEPSTPTIREPQKKRAASRNRTLNELFDKQTPSKPASLENKENEPSEKKDLPKSQEQTYEKDNSVVSVSKLGTSDSVPTPRWGHSLCLINDSQAVLIGGQGARQQLAKDSCWLLNTEIETWSEQATTSKTNGVNPELRMGHTATYNPALKCLYVFGGSKHKKWFSDVHVLDCEEWTWQKAEVNGIAPQRAYHSATLYRYELWVFGGVFPNPDPQPDGCSNDIQIYSPMEQNWYQPIVMGEKPSARSGHSATLVDGELVIFGGWDAPVCYNDLHILDMMFVEWKMLEPSGAPPSPRCWHASCALSSKRIAISGGYNGDEALQDTFILDLSTNSWTSVMCKPALTPCAGHTALCLSAEKYDGDEDKVYVFGGGDNDGQFFNESYKLAFIH